MEEIEQHRTRLGAECFRPGVSEDEKRESTKAWEKASSDYWKIHTVARNMDIQHMEMAQRLRESFGYAPEQAVDLGKARRMEMARMQTEANKEADEE
eukprot:4470351-Heterocapsa_arctica.AAC.1